MSSVNLSLEEAIEVAVETYTLAPEDGWRFHDGKAEPWSGWRCSFVDRRRRPRRVSFLVYNAAVEREAMPVAIRAWFEELGR